MNYPSQSFMSQGDIGWVHRHGSQR